MPASTISLGQLHGAVSAAVKAATEKHKLRLESELAIGPGILVGPLLRPDVPVEQAKQIAEEITQAAQNAMPAGQGVAAIAPLRSGVLFHDRIILCGFWPPGPILDIGRDFGRSGPG